MSGLFEALGFLCLGRSAADRFQRKQTLPILVYHRFDRREASTPWTVRASVFEQQLEWLFQNGYRFVGLQAVVDSLRGDGPSIASPAVALTADDGDCSVYTHMFPIILRYAIPVTLFICPSAISRSADALSWDQLAKMRCSGLVDIQFHTLSHCDFRYERKRRSPADYSAFVKFELSHWRDLMQERIGSEVNMLAWPYGFYDAELEQLAESSGYVAAFAVKNNKATESSIYAVPRISIRDDHIGHKLRLRLAQGGASLGALTPSIGQ